MPRRPTLTVPLTDLAAEARRLWDEAVQIRQQVMDSLDLSLERGWRLGQVLCRIKVAVGHGNWLLWLTENLPEITDRQAQRHMVLHVANPLAHTIADLHPDSVRKFRLGYVPAKERAALEGDESVEPAAHHLTILNDWRRWQRRVAIGTATLQPEQARKDLRPLWDWLRELYGPQG